jgi:hypothetical protein
VTVIFLAAAIVALVAPQTYIAPFMWCVAFATPVIEAIMVRRIRN